MLKSFRTYQIALKFYFLCREIRCHGEVRDQLLRASLSITLNLAEGSAKPTVRDRTKFYFIALGSFRECEALLNVLEVEPSGYIHELSDKLGSHLFKLIKRQSDLHIDFFGRGQTEKRRKTKTETQKQSLINEIISNKEPSSKAQSAEGSESKGGSERR